MFDLRPNGPGMIEGIVTSNKAVPIPDAQVTIELDPAGDDPGLPFPPWATTTNARGEFCIRGLPVEPSAERLTVGYRVTAQADNDCCAQRTWLWDEHSHDFLFLIAPSRLGPEFDEYESESDPEFDELLANLDYCGATVSGYVLDADTGEPIEGVTIQCSRHCPGPDRTAYAKSDSTGYYCLDRLPPGHRVLFRRNKPGYLIGKGRESKNVLLETRQVIENVNFTVRRGLNVSGRVIDVKGEPVSGVCVHNTTCKDDDQSQTVLTDESGSFVMQGYVQNSLICLELTNSPFWAEPLVDIEVGDSGVSGLEIVARPAATVVGIVVDEFGGPAEDNCVYIVSLLSEEIYESTSTWEHGEFYFRGLPPGEYELSVGTNKRFLQLAAGELASGIVLEAPSRHRLESVARRNCFLSGRLINSLGLPVSSARVLAFTRPPEGVAESRGESESDADGCFRVEALGEGEHQITVCADGYAVAIRHGVPANSVDVEIVLVRLITVSGIVIDDATGAPIRDFSVARTDRVPRNLEYRRLEFTTHCDPYGRFSVWSYPGSIAVIARAHGYATAYVWLPDVAEGTELIGEEIRLKRVT